MPSTTVITVLPVNSIRLPEFAGSAPIGRSSNAGPGCVPARLHWLTTESPRRSTPRSRRSRDPGTRHGIAARTRRTASRPLQRLQPDVGCGDLIDDGRLEAAAPEAGTPAHDDDLIVLDRHGTSSGWADRRGGGGGVAVRSRPHLINATAPECVSPRP